MGAVIFAQRVASFSSSSSWWRPSVYRPGGVKFTSCLTAPITRRQIASPAQSPTLSLADEISTPFRHGQPLVQTFPSGDRMQFDQLKRREFLTLLAARPHTRSRRARSGASAFGLLA